MKKFMAILMVAVLAMAMAVPAMAAKSPEAEELHKIHLIDGDGAKVVVKTIKDGEGIDFVADANKGKFDGWTVYLADGKTVAVLGEHYTLGEGQALSAASIKLFPKTDLIVTGNYNGVTTKVEVNDNGEVSSPQTGDATVVCLSAVMLLALAGMVMLKKRTA